MLTRLVVRNFKRFDEIDIELGEAVVFIGPNNSGKTSALQALALWQLGVRRWVERRRGGGTPEKRPGVTLNRRDLISLPVPAANLLWRDLHVRSVSRENGKQRTQNIRIEVQVDGISGGKVWSCGLEFDYANQESFYCRPMSRPDGTRMSVPDEAGKVEVAFLPPMSGLTATESRLDPGAVQVRIGEGRTAEVLRNLCLSAHDRAGDGWQRLCRRIEALFGARLRPPEYVAERGEVVLTYQDLSGATLDISSSGRGLQQTLLLLAYLDANPGAALLLDEPDAHLEILRQRQIYQLLTDVARERGNQIIAASHSEVLLNEAADRDMLMAFVGKPHRIDDRGSQVLKSLKEIGFEQYYQAEQMGWVLYLEGPTDLAILRALAETLEHPAIQSLERPFVHYVANQPTKAEAHFFGLKEAKPDLAGIALFDRLERPPASREGLGTFLWKRREIENYLCLPEALLAFAEKSVGEAVVGPLFEDAERRRYRSVMENCIGDLVPPIALRDRSHKWWSDVKASDEFLDGLFAAFFRGLALPNLMRKSDYHRIARFVPKEMIASEVGSFLDMIVQVAAKAKPVTGA